MPRNKLVKAAAVVVSCVALGTWVDHQLTLNPTPSLCQTLFILNKDVTSTDIKPGDIVRFPFSDSFTRGAVFLLKHAACIQGQSLEVNERKEYFCDGRYLGRAKDKSAKGLPVQNFRFNGLVPAGKFFALGDHIDSYDSRYFGFVNLSTVVAKAYPLF